MCRYAVLIITDAPSFLRITAEFFRCHNYKVYAATTCLDGIAAARKYHPACILLDFHLREGAAIDLCACIRSAGDLKATPIIMVNCDETQEINAYLKCKADNCVVKCGPPEKTLAVVESLLRRVDWDRGVVEKGDIRLESVDFRVFRDSRPLLNLPAKQFYLFSLLVDKSPDFVSEDDIAKYVFDSDFAPGKTDAIRGVAHRLRRNLGAQLGRRIKNKASRGWIYVHPQARIKNH